MVLLALYRSFTNAGQGLFAPGPAWCAEEHEQRSKKDYKIVPIPLCKLSLH